MSDKELVNIPNNTRLNFSSNLSLLVTKCLGNG
jgi:hypothetical protein